MPNLIDGHIEKCLSLVIVPATEGWTPPHVRLDTVVGSGLPQCQLRGQARPLHFLGDCKWALYESPQIPCLICGEDDHILEQCLLPGTSVVGCETLQDLYSMHLTKLNEKGQCYICKGYHLPEGKFDDQHYTSKSCLHSLLAMGKVRWDRKESMREQSKDHSKYLQIPESKRQRGADGRPIQQKPPEKQWSVKRLDKIFEQLKDQ